MAAFTRAIAARFPRRTATVEISYAPGDGDEFEAISATATLREMSGADRARFAQTVFYEKADGTRRVDELAAQAGLVARCWIDPETGKRNYGDDEVEQLAQDLPASVVGKLAEAAQRLNGLGAAATETAEKN